MKYYNSRLPADILPYLCLGVINLSEINETVVAKKNKLSMKNESAIM
jgi:hypothetical protein